jgi:hypothetical protein
VRRQELYPEFAAKLVDIKGFSQEAVSLLFTISSHNRRRGDFTAQATALSNTVRQIR